jgi:mannose-6-phosphate isomerase-like protein (cupin superfamily)
MSPTTATPAPTVLTPQEVASLPLQPLGALAGVEHRALWRSDTSMAGVLAIEGGHRLGPHAHRRHDHHLWVLDGEAVVLGTTVGPGSYVHVPVGVEHDIDATGSQGCTVFYLYVLPEG